MKRLLRIVGIIICGILLLLVRGFEDNLFYDPLLEFFKGDYTRMPIPEMDVSSLLMGLAFRYFLNTLISLFILWLVFLDRGIIKLSVLLYVVLFALFMVVFTLLIYSLEGTDNLLVLFYVRRFLIQPLFLLILVPAFYFQKQKSA
ncbi:exosortase F system-associated protein [Aequorivita sp. H23M31]|uniref:Exosortase F system-associated protein n=1 Tax=Aequorivita ciconiae TaxID=2494375 RepID=A0A410G301_9FLAO|nr:exosortase F system-associated protein [Aequorivita sp. H23M31]QAA81640.1 exosortase F system-associated protein [Aequorivita sp. H23M31]